MGYRAAQKAGRQRNVPLHQRRAVETLAFSAAYCVAYHEQFASGDAQGGAYQCFLTLSDPTGWTMAPGGPAAAFVAPAARDHGVPAAAAAAAVAVVPAAWRELGIGGAMGAGTPAPDGHAAAWEAAAGTRVPIGEEVAAKWLLENAGLLTTAATVPVAQPAIEEATTAQTVTPGTLRPKTSAAMLLADGTILTASSQRGLPDDEMPANLHQDVIDVLDTVDKDNRGDGHGRCAEPQIISQAIRAGKSLKGAKSLAMLVRPEGNKKYRFPICACDSCRVLLALRWSRNSGQKKDVYFFCYDSKKERRVARQTA
jgi:hypothetical protein